jgi:Tol biopolymer transport system component
MERRHSRSHGGEMALALRVSRRTRVLSLLCLAMLSGVLPASAQGYTRLVSQGSQGPVVADNVALSISGRFVAFRSASPYLNGLSTFTDIFIYDRWSGVASRVTSTHSQGGVTDGNSSNPTISADGRYVAFESVATNLIAGDLNGSVSDVFVRDRVLNTTTLISRSTTGAQGNGRSSHPYISGDGRYVTFTSVATNLASGATNGKEQVYLYDRQTGRTSLVSHIPTGAAGNNNSLQPSIAYDGSFVAFHSVATDLVSGDNNGKADVFLYDRAADTLTRISGTAPVTGDSTDASISADGSTIAFACLLPSAANPAVNQTDVYFYLRASATYVLASVSGAGMRGDASSDWPSLSADGRFVAFGSDATNLVVGDNNADRDIFVRDRVAGTTIRVNVGSDGVAPGGSFPNGPEVRSYLSGDGRYVALNSSGGLVPGAAGTLAAYLRDTKAFTTGWITRGANFASVLPTGHGAISPDGRYVGFISLANNLVANDTNGTADVFLRDRFAGTTTRVSVSSDGSQGNADSLVRHSVGVTADGTVVFDSDASNLVADDSNHVPDVFVHDASTGHTLRMSVRSDGSQSNGGGWDGRISSDGRYVVFDSDATDLVPTDTNGATDIFVRDRVAGTTTRVSVSSTGVEGNGTSLYGQVAITGDVAFQSAATNLVVAPGFAPFRFNIFVHTALGQTELISSSPLGVAGDNNSDSPVMTPDGAFVAFDSQATNLDPNGDTNGFVDVYVADRVHHKMLRASLASDGTEPNADCVSPSISDDGRFVTFESRATNLVPTVVNGALNVFVHDMVTGETFFISYGAAGSADPSISGDGRTIVFNAANLVNDDTTNVAGVYVRAFAPTLDGISPPQDSVDGGAAITLTGTDFRDTPLVTLGGAYAPWVALSGTNAIDVMTPARPAGLTTATVFDLDGGQTSLFGFRYVGCTFDLPLSGTTAFGSTGGYGFVPVTASGPGCRWSATSSAGWITVTSGTANQGSGAVTFTVAVNATPGVPRTAILTIAGQPFFVLEAASPTVHRPLASDLDGDGGADLTVWRGSNGTFYSLFSGTGYDYPRNEQIQWGSETLGDVPLLGDVDGDGVADLIVWRAATGTWYWLTSSTGYNYAAADQRQWGQQSLGDVPLLGDIDGDGKVDLVIWRASTGTWFWLTSSSGYSYSAAGSKQWGSGGLGDVPLLGDFDGDGKTDLAVWRASTGTWFWLTSSSGYSYSAAASKQWGSGGLGDVPLLGDFDGDGKADLAVWRASTGTWFWLTSSSGYDYNAAGARQWGNASLGDTPMLGDLDRDGRADLVVWRASTGTWYWLTSSSGYAYNAGRSIQWGNGSSVYRDRPVLR